MQLLHPTAESSYGLRISKLKKKLKTLKTDSAKQRVLNEIKTIEAQCEADPTANPAVYRHEQFDVVTANRRSVESRSDEEYSEQRAPTLP